MMWNNGVKCITLTLSALFLFDQTNSSDCGCNKVSRSSNDKKEFLSEDTSDRSCPISDVKKTEKFSQMALIKSGEYEIGTDQPVFVADGEAPARYVYLDEFYMDLYEVSNQDFLDFVLSSNYTTEAEKFGNSFVFSFSLSNEIKSKITQVVASTPWWMPVENASWHHPEGPDSDLKS